MSFYNTIRCLTDHPLNRASKLGSIMRFARWQIGSRLVPGAIVYDWVNGSRFLVRAGEKGLTGNIYAGLHEFADMGFLLHFLRAEDLFVDVGANAGSYTILACSGVGARGVAFEPVPSTFKRLVENMRLNDLDERVQCVNKGVGATQGTLAFTGDDDTENRALAAGEKYDDHVVVEVVPLDAALRGEVPALMKVDVEGFEAPVLEGAQGTLSNAALNAVIMELNGSGARYGFHEEEILELMLGHGFGTYSYDPFRRALIDLEGKKAESLNTLFIRDKAFVADRLREASTVAVHGREF